MPEAVTALVGDRDGALDALRGHSWDVVIDNSGFNPSQVRLTVELLEPNVGAYLFVSSVSAYGDGLPKGQAESDPPLATVDDPIDESEPPYGPSYGARKARCEGEVLDVFGPNRTTIVRPGFITGPGDATDRVRHWLARAALSREILAPGDPGAPVQFIDARDLGEWIVRMTESGISGTFNGVGPLLPTTAADLVTCLVSTVRSDAEVTWVPWSFLGGGDVGDFSYLPVLPASSAAMMTVQNRAAVGSGLTLRTLEETGADMYAEYVAVAKEIERFGLRGGISTEAEREILAAWRRESGAP